MTIDSDHGNLSVMDFVYNGGTVSGTVAMTGLTARTLSFGSQTVGSGNFQFQGVDSNLGTTTASGNVPGGANVLSRAIQTTLSRP